MYILVDGGWTSFSKFTWNNDCSAACGVGVESGYRTRSCSNPTPAYGGKTCSGAATEKATRSCKIKECPSKFSFVLVANFLLTKYNKCFLFECKLNFVEKTKEFIIIHGRVL